MREAGEGKTRKHSHTPTYTHTHTHTHLRIFTKVLHLSSEIYILCNIPLAEAIRHFFLPVLALADEVRRSFSPMVASTKVHWQSKVAGKLITDVATSVYMCKSTSNPQWWVNVLLTPVLWLPWYKLITPPAGYGKFTRQQLHNPEGVA